ncbi:MAG: cell division protein FtsQ/DivIB [Alphaproteobacteria bacterium]|nr:cell division protein FtsQ/DivIB [Alphaproteobacteria bacterium]
MRKNLIFWLTFALAMIVALYFTVRMSMAVMGISNIAPTGRISIYPGTSSGRGNSGIQEIADALNIRPKSSAYSVNIKIALANISALPDVKNAAIRRLPNGRIMVRVAQRDIVAAWTDGLNFYPLSDDGRTVARYLDVLPAGTLVFTGELPGGVGLVAGTIKRETALSKEVARIEWVEGRRWNIYTNSGVKIMLPETNWDKAIAKVGAQQKQSKILNREISVLDMRDENRTLVKINRMK